MSPTSSSPLRAGSSARRSSTADPSPVLAPAGSESHPGGAGPPEDSGEMGDPDDLGEMGRPGGVLEDAAAGWCSPRSPCSNPSIELVY